MIWTEFLLGTDLGEQPIHYPPLTWRDELVEIQSDTILAASWSPRVL